MDHLERAREELTTASETADGEVQRQLQSIRGGVFEEEEDGRLTQPEPGPKVDRIVELVEQLEELEDGAQTVAAANAMADAREHLETYLKENPEGGYPEDADHDRQRGAE